MVMASQIDTVTADELVGRARALMPVVRERAAGCEDLRRLPEDTEQAFRDAGFYRILQPARHGGLEMDYGIQTELAFEIGQGCASSAWNLSVVACHAWILGMFPPEAQDAVWGGTPDATIATSFLPKEGVEASREDGGVRIKGRWGFSSGVDYCSAAILILDVPPEDGGGKPEPRFVLLTRDDYEVEDTWYAAGLSGTGSNDIVVADAFVPDAHTLAVMATRGGPTPGSAVNPGYLYRLPLFAVFPFNLIGAALGAARGAVDTVSGGLAGRRTVSGVSLAEQQNVHLRIAEAGAQADAAHALVMRHRDDIKRRGQAGGVADIPERARCRRDIAYAAKLCVGAMEGIFPLLGGRGLMQHDPVQRAWRDVHAAAQHIGLVWDLHAGIHGAVAAGLDCPDPRL